MRGFGGGAGIRAPTPAPGRTFPGSFITETWETHPSGGWGKSHFLRGSYLQPSLRIGRIWMELEGFQVYRDPEPASCLSPDPQNAPTHPLLRPCLHLSHHHKAWKGGSNEDPVGLRPHFLLEKNGFKQLSSPGVDILPLSSQRSILSSN